MKLKDKIVCLTNLFDEKFTTQFGFRPGDVTFTKVVDYLHAPKDSSSLAVTRILFGVTMLFDIPDERGGATMEHRWGDQKACHFPLLPFLNALPMPYMAHVYAGLWMGALGITLGYKYRVSATMFAVCYWYLFLIEKSFWNNHSYLYGLISLLLVGTRANCYWSLDARHPAVHSETVPYWNYFVLKYQFFILYFMAGLKKGTAEWLSGYSLLNLAEHWVFAPFRSFLTVEQTDYMVVHWFAFLFDLTVAFWMMWSKSRHVAMIFCAAFHLMNIRLFRIGMFPWVCLATMPLFYPFNWPKQVLQRLAELKNNLNKIFYRTQIRIMFSCFYRFREEQNYDEDLYSEEIFEVNESNDEVDIAEIFKKYETKDNEISHPEKPTDEPLEPEEKAELEEFQKNSFQRQMTVCLIIVYMALQAFLPYSHFLTKGYNNWTPGLYGYSWDMMVHTWDVNSVVVKVVDHDHEIELFVDPYAWTPNDRWNRHGDMVWQFAHCLERNLVQDTDVTSRNISIYVDVWCSLNGRFQQRVFDPKVDLLKAPWSPFEEVQWLMPLLSEAESWRSVLDQIRADVHGWNDFSDVVFIADFPGYDLENYLAPELTNVTLMVLEGTVAYEPEVNYTSKGQSFLLKTGDVTYVTSGRFHKVINIGSKPAYYMYTFLNKTEAEESSGSTNKAQNKPLLPLGSEFRRRIDNALIFFYSVFKSFFGCQHCIRNS